MHKLELLQHLTTAQGLMQMTATMRERATTDVTRVGRVARSAGAVLTGCLQRVIKNQISSLEAQV